MIQTSKNGEYTNIPISELYNIIDIYKKSFKNEDVLHSNCLCNSCFENDELHINTSYQLENYIFTHFEKMTKITKQYDNFCEKYKNVSWLIDQNVDFNGMTNDFKIKQYFQFMGYNDRYVFIVYIKPQFNELNCNQTLTNAIYDSFIVKNVKKPNEDDTEHIKKNYERFYNKEIVCIVFSTDLDMPYYIDWKNKEGENILNTQFDMILHIIYSDIITKYDIENKMVYNFYKYWRKQKTGKSPLDIITFIISQLNNIAQQIMDPRKGKMAIYIHEFFDNIKFRIENSSDKKEQINILKEYDNKEIFLNLLKQRMIPFISRYFSINTQNDDDILDSDLEFSSDNEN